MSSQVGRKSDRTEDQLSEPARKDNLKQDRVMKSRRKTKLRRQKPAYRHGDKRFNEQ